MPRKQVTKTVCTTCGKTSCDGGIWKWVSIHESGVPVPMTTIPVENTRCCTLHLGQGHRKSLAGKAVGDEVDLDYPNWVRPAVLRVQKIED